jgi:hypothetical protein
VAFDKTRYDVEYSKNNVMRLFMSFNRNKPEDVELLEYARMQGNVTAYIKTLIRADMGRKNGVSLSDRLSNETDNPQEG